MATRTRTRRPKARLTTYIAGGFWDKGGEHYDVWIKPMRHMIRNDADVAGPMTTLHITRKNDPTGYFTRKFRQIMQRDRSPEVVSR
jgi:hypothetical protein